MNTTTHETSQPWAPNMVFRARRHMSVPRTLCERFIEEQVVTFFRTYFPVGGPNFDYGPIMERAVRFVVYIDLLRDNTDFRIAFFSMLQNQTPASSLAAADFQDHELTDFLKALSDIHWPSTDQLAVARAQKLDFYSRDPDMIDQLIWGLTHQDDAHPGVCVDLDNDYFFLAVLLIRHFKYHGGLVLPPLKAARTKQAAHEALVTSEKALNRSTETLFMYYPNWRDSQDLARPPGLGGPTRALTTVPTLASNFPAGRPLNERSPPCERNPFGVVGDSRPRH